MTARRPIVVGTDGSSSSLQAVAWAAQAAALRRCPLSVIATTFVAGAYGVPIGMPTSFFEDEERNGKNRLAAAAEAATRAVPGYSLDIHTTLCTGTPAGELLERSNTAAMIVVGSSRRGIVERGFLGSVSSAVAAHARCPVAVVRSIPDTDVTQLEGSVVVGVDGSAHSEPAISMAFEEAALRQCELVAVHAWSDIDLPVHFEGGSVSGWKQIVTQETALLSESLAGRAEDFPDVKVRTMVVMDRPVRNLREQADNARLLVVGSRGRGGFTSMLLGSTSRALMHSVRCPLLIVR
ncbi:universal stress protein [Rhodococcus sp. ACS1]|jgi:nucleotide-binding universal stress UspA family protein|uniref:Nucleotide-binding universal stress protein, UspA family n=1 Tax=Rhodococcus koreensis TaxID=99653 RepID=A0A1H5EWE1_9NOCA|nr:MULTISPECIES: universal stress protein [Rhodococcus]PBC40065.1 universal stress protein [Rhodococcus sp. ACS1]SED95431.1 Nucleotide-binding universal stress protein, UspA family [Rhodococcus koreensis]